MGPRLPATGQVGDGVIVSRTPPSSVAVCSVPGCGRPHNAFGLCHTHRHRQLRTGEAGGPIKTVGSSVLCTAAGCPSTPSGLCRPHYDRWRKEHEH